jgi:hypothetical protein
MFAPRYKFLLTGAAMVVVALLLPVSPLSPSIVLPPPLPSEAPSLLLATLGGLEEPARFRLFPDGTGAEWAAVTSGQRRFELVPALWPAAPRDRLLAAMPFGSLIAEAADHYRLDGLLLAAVVEAESGFDPGAVSPRGAQGLMQIMPETAAHVGLLQPQDPRANVRAGARYLRDQLRRFDDDLVLALAAYNAGPGNVLRYRGVPPFRETRTYVRRVMANYLRLHQELWLEIRQSPPSSGENGAG